MRDLFAIHSIDGMRDKRVLVIEDDEGIREMLCIALELEGFAVVTAGNGREGLEALASMERPSLILLDLMMPIMNGWEFYDVLKDMPAHSDIPVIVLTAFKEMSERISAKEIITKPFSLDALVEAVNKFAA